MSPEQIAIKKKKEEEKGQRKILYRKEEIKIKEAILVANRYSTIIVTLSNYKSNYEQKLPKSKRDGIYAT